MKQIFAHLRGDIFGGVTAGIIALPLALAFGVQSGLGPAAGLYGAIALGFFAALFGGTPTQVSGPTGPMTVISTVIISQAVASIGNIESAMGIILLTFFLAGAFQILFGFMRIGQYVRYIPYPVVSGFMSGIGVIIIIFQLYPILGQASPKTTIDVIATFIPALQNINWYSLGVGASTIAIIYLFPYVTRKVPSLLIALLSMTAIAYIMKLPISTIGDIPQTLPALQFDAFQHVNFLQNFRLIIIPAITLSALGVIDTLLTSVVADNLTRTKHNSNKELIGQGIGNMVAALFGGLPGAGATMRTVVNIRSGGSTRLSGMIHSIMLLSILLGLSQYATQIPHAVLAGILISVGINIIDYKGLKHITHVPKADTAVMAIVFIMTVFVDLLQAVVVGLVLASVLFMKKMGEINGQRTRGSFLEKLKQEENWPQDEPPIPNELFEKIYVKELYGPLFFGFSSQFQGLVNALPKVKIVIIRMDRVPYMDQSGLYAIEDAVQYLHSQGVKIALISVQEQPLDMMKRINLIPGLINSDMIFENFHDAVRWFTISQEDNTHVNSTQ